MFKKTLASTFIISAFAATTAFASDALPSDSTTFEKYGEADGWTVYVDTDRKSCLIERMDEAGNVLQMGLTKDHKYGYVGVFSKNDIGLSGGKEKVIISVGGNEYEGKARKKTKHLADGYTGGYVLTDNTNFVTDVADQTEMIVFPKKESAFTVSLDGTKKALEAGRKCNMENNS